MSSPHTTSGLAFRISLPLVLAAFAITGAVCFYRARKRRPVSSSEATFAVPFKHCDPPPSARIPPYSAKYASDEFLTDGIESQPPLSDPQLSQSATSSRPSHQPVSRQGYSTQAHDENSRAAPFSSALVHDPLTEKEAHRGASTLPGPTPAALDCPHSDHPITPNHDLRRRFSAEPLVPSVSPAHVPPAAASSFDNLAPTSTSGPFLQAQASLPPPSTSAYNTHALIGGPHLSQDGSGAGGQDRVLVLPWPLGERLLALLASTPQEHVLGEFSSSAESETLPAYEPRD